MCRLNRFIGSKIYVGVCQCFWLPILQCKPPRLDQAGIIRTAILARVMSAILSKIMYQAITKSTEALEGTQGRRSDKRRRFKRPARVPKQAVYPYRRSRGLMGSYPAARHRPDPQSEFASTVGICSAAARDSLLYLRC